MDSQAGHIMTIANSIIGVSLLAMPYCFKQCGIILSILILVLSNVISRLSCHLMLKSAIMARRRTFEFLAFHSFGPLGKFITEIGLIGFLLGTCIAYFVVMGDLGPAIIAKMTGARATDTMRTSILMALALFCVLPLGLLRNIDSLNSVCMATIGFYFCLVLKIIAESLPHIFSGDWIDRVELWRPAGILQCLPIFSMSLSCQTQIFEVYQTIPTASLDKMNHLIRVAVNICTGVYIFVGIFGYIAFANQTFSGNILMSFSASLISDIMKIGFVLSLAFSFPLIIFPCRASLYSLLYKRTYPLHEGADKYIPENRFKGLTFLIVFVSLVIGVMIPTIELVLGLVGSTIGIMVCVLFPATCFICISTKNTNERILAQIMLFIGVLIMVLGTYANLYAMEEISTTPVVEKVTIAVPEILKIVEEDAALKVIDIPNTTKSPVDFKINKKEPEPQDTIKEVRHEPPQPEEPAEQPPQIEVKKVEPQANEVKEETGDKPKDLNIEKPIDQQNINAASSKKDGVDNPVLQEPLKESNNVKEAQVPANKLDANLNGEAVEKNDNENKEIPKEFDLNAPSPDTLNINKPKGNKEQDENKKSSDKKTEEVDIEAIKKEEKELLEQEKEKLKEEEKKNLDLIKRMQKQNEDQKKLEKLVEQLKQQQQKLEQNKQQNEIEKVKKESLKAVEQIEQIAKQAIKKLGGGDQQNPNGKPQPQGNSAKVKGNEIEEIVKKVKEKLNTDNKQDQINNVQPQENTNKKIKDDQSKLNEVIGVGQGENFIHATNKPDEVNLKGADVVNVNNDLNVKNKENLNINYKPKDVNYKLELNKANLVPLPIAKSNNFSGSYRNLVAPAANEIVPNLQAASETEPKPKTIDQNQEKLDVVKQTDIKDIPQNKIPNREPEKINILEVLKTNAEKVTALNQDKTSQPIQHREIRSVNDKDALQESEVNNGITNDEKEKAVEEKQKDIPEKSEDTCDKEDKNVKDNNKQNIINKVDKPDSTESPLIKMITKLSEPELVSIKLPDVDRSILKPLKRDLKSFKFRKRK